MKKVAVIGAGAVGGIVAVHLIRTGHRVEVICKHEDLARKLSQVGIQIQGVAGSATVPVDARAHIDQLSGPQDLVFLATKATDIQGAAQDLLPFLHPDSAVVTMQNGIVEDLVGSIIGRERVVGCVVHWGSTARAPGEIEQTSHGLFVIGELDGGRTPRLDEIKSYLSGIEPVEITAYIYGALYTKLVINSCINSLGVLCGSYLGEMLGMRKARELFLGIINEALVVAERSGLEPEPIENLDLYRLAGDPSLGKHLMIRYIGFKYRKLKSSSLQSIERGRPTEVDYLNGYIVQRGEQAGVDAPVNRAILEMIKEIEAGSRPIAAENIDELYASSRI